MKEVLVVPAVLTIFCSIAGILLWEIGLAQTSGQQSPCVKNARQLALATMLYAQDYDTDLPPMRSAALFQKAVLPYVASAKKRKPALTNVRVFDPSHIQRVEEDVNKVRVTAKDRRVFLCPETKQSYLLNPGLSNQVAFYTNLESPTNVKGPDNSPGYPEHANTTWLFRDTSAHKDGLYTVVFADTHIGRLKLPPDAARVTTRPIK